ncbi:hypothetical protein ACM25O_13305 [Sulfitobacter pontiacus]
MTHYAYIRHNEPIPWADCEMDRYDTNNGVVLRHRPTHDHRYGDVLFYIDGADLGLDVQDGPEIALPRAQPLFEVMLKAHNEALERGKGLGRAAAQAEMRMALGINRA